MAEDIVRLKYEADVTALKGEINSTLSPLTKIDELAKQTGKTVTEETNKAAKSYGKLEKELRDLEKASKAAHATKEIKQQSSELKKLDTNLKNVSKDAKNAGKDLKGLSGKTKDLGNVTGQANNATIELGRTISDAPYGIRGMANNIQQLGTQFTQLIKTTGGVGSALRAIATSLAGPLGVLLAFQAVVAAVDYFFGSTKKATEATDENEKATKAQSEAVKYATAQREKQNEQLRETEERISKINDLTTKEIKLQVAQAQSRVNENNKLIESLEKRATITNIAEDAQLKYNDAVDDFVSPIDIDNQDINSILDIQDANRKAAHEQAEFTKQRAKDVMEYGDLLFEVKNDQKFINAAMDALKGSTKKSTNALKDLKKETKDIAEGMETIKELSEGDLLAINLLIKEDELDAENQKFVNSQRKTLDKLSTLQRKWRETETKEQQQYLNNQINQYQSLGIAIGQSFGILASDVEDKQKEFLKSLLLTALDALQNQIRIFEAQIIGQALATGVGIPFAIGKVAAIEGLFAAARGSVQNFHDGSEFVTGARGRDKIPANIEYGERVVSARDNALLNNIPNRELPKAVALYEAAKSKGFAERMAASLNVNNALNDSGIIKSNNGTTKAIERLSKQLTKQQHYRNGF